MKEILKGQDLAAQKHHKQRPRLPAQKVGQTLIKKYGAVFTGLQGRKESALDIQLGRIDSSSAGIRGCRA